MIRTSEIKVYIFKKDEGFGREERLLHAVERYCKESVGNADKDLRNKISDRACLQVEKTPRGKPFFPKFQELQLSISHSGVYWVCALAPKEVGVDIQEHTIKRSETRQEAEVRFAKMARRFFHPVEAKFVEVESFYRFFGVWTARESYVKYTGQGINASFSEYCGIPKTLEQWPELTPLLPEPLEPLLSGRLMQRQANAQLRQGNGVSWHAQGAWFWETVFEENYTLCVCAGEEIPCRVINCF
jgi:phosphopantetheinyl transferase (holo-ACP synthase)